MNSHFSKIKYRYVFGRTGRLNKDGRGLVQLECLLNGERIYISAHIYLYPNQWQGQYIVNHPLAAELNEYLFAERIKVERIEMDFVKTGKMPTLSMLKNAVKYHVSASASFKDFTLSFIKHAPNRGKHTKDSYQTLVKIMERFQRGTAIRDIDIDWLNRFVDWQKSQHLSQSTISGRLKSIRAIINEAKARKLLSVDDDPFIHFKIPKIVSRKEALTGEELDALERLQLRGREKHLRDVFMFDCMCGLRFSDLKRLTDDCFQQINGKQWLIMPTQKTKTMARVPIETIFGGRAWEILQRYRSIKGFARIGNNAASNRTLKAIFAKAGVRKDAHWHLGRHTFITLAIEQGIPLAIVQLMAAHSKVETTMGYADLSIRSIEKAVG